VLDYFDIKTGGVGEHLCRKHHKEYEKLSNIFAFELYARAEQICEEVPLSWEPDVKRFNAFKLAPTQRVSEPLHISLAKFYGLEFLCNAYTSHFNNWQIKYTDAVWTVDMSKSRKSLIKETKKFNLENRVRA